MAFYSVTVIQIFIKLDKSEQPTTHGYVRYMFIWNLDKNILAPTGTQGVMMCCVVSYYAVIF